MITSLKFGHQEFVTFKVLWSMVMSNGFSGSYIGAFMLYPIFAGWAALTISVMGNHEAFY